MLEKLLNRRSERFYNKSTLSEKTINEITEVINSSPTSINAHGFSAIIITDQEKLDKLSELNWNQPHIKEASAFVLFVGDLYRTKSALGQEDYSNLSEEMKGELINVAIVDATIASGLVTSYLLDNNLGSCFIGGVRTYPKQLQEMLNLDENVFPVVGLTIGTVSQQNEIRPKLNKTFVEKYDTKLADEEITSYDEKMELDYKKRDETIVNNWSMNTRNQYNMFDKYAMYKDFKGIISKIVK